MLIPNYSFYTNLNHFDFNKLNGLQRIIKFPPAVDSVGVVDSKEKFGIFIFFIMLIFLSILVSEIAIMAKLLLVDLIKYSRSSELRETERERQRERQRESHNICTMQHSRGHYDHLLQMCCSIG